MKPINKKTLIWIAALGAMVLIADIILFFALEAISGTAFGVTAILSAPFAIIPLLFLYAPDEMEVIIKGSILDHDGWLPRTKESTLFEAASALILIITWVIAYATHNLESVAPLISTLVAIILLITAYFKRKTMYSFRLTLNMRQILIQARLSRILAVVTALFGMVAVCPGINTSVLPVVYIILACIICCIGIYLMAKHAKDKDVTQE